MFLQLIIEWMFLRCTKRADIQNFCDLYAIKFIVTWYFNYSNNIVERHLVTFENRYRICEQFAKCGEDGSIQAKNNVCISACTTGTTGLILSFDGTFCLDNCTLNDIAAYGTKRVVSAPGILPALRCVESCTNSFMNSNTTACVISCQTDDFLRFGDMHVSKCVDSCSPAGTPKTYTYIDTISSPNRHLCVTNCKNLVPTSLLNYEVTACAMTCPQSGGVDTFATVLRDKCVKSCKTEDSGSLIDKLAFPNVCVANCVVNVTYTSVDKTSCVSSCLVQDSPASFIDYQNKSCVAACDPNAVIPSFKVQGAVPDRCVSDCKAFDGSMISADRTKCEDICSTNTYITVNQSNCVNSCYLEDNNAAIHLENCVATCPFGTNQYDRYYLTYNSSNCIFDCKLDTDGGAAAGRLIDSTKTRCISSCPVSQYLTLNKTSCVVSCYDDDDAGTNGGKRRLGQFRPNNITCVDQCIYDPNQIIQEYATADMKKCVLRCDENPLQVINATKNGCMLKSNCLSGSILYNTEKDTYCQVCPALSTSNAEQTACICASHQIYDPQSNSCTSCPENSNMLNNICTCNVISGQQMVNGVCLCVNTYSVVQGSSCVCPDNSHLQFMACVCNTDSFILSTNEGILQCQVCPPLTSPDSAQITCVCPQNQIYNLQNKSCDACPANSKAIGNRCICDICGQQIVFGECQCVKSNSYIHWRKGKVQ
ncbi:Multiple_epidermal growth factor-like domains protein [Hexamita inflata]|uniref:Multiple epidermal growth factor-like domains protein n=1 Tax=Hexamita inflata TaxID=28002 RepID=A0AA86PS45_9EUKA|nr:Multiple epidermal growth factor-like domains protein [Hexamita inflata]